MTDTDNKSAFLALSRDVGRLEGQVLALQAQVSDLRTALKAQTELSHREYLELRAGTMEVAKALERLVDRIAAQENQIRGGWWVLTVLGAVAASIGGFVTWLFSFLKGQ